MFFPTLVLGTINGVLNPICNATSDLMLNQSFNMKQYQKEKNELQSEALRRNAEIGYMIRNAEFDKEIEMLG